MFQTLTRRALYDLAWSEPMQALAKRFSLSDRGLAKICAAANIPVPTRGYWARKQAGKDVTQPELPPRDFGQSDNVRIGFNPYERASDEQIINAPVPPPPVFDVDMDTVRAQASKLVAKAPLPLREGQGWHSLIQKLLDADEERVRKQRASPYPSPWNDPIFRTPFEQRRLRILNALFTCFSRCGMQPRLTDKSGRDLSVTVGDILVSFTLDGVAAAKQIERERQGYGFIARADKDKMRLSVSSRWSSSEKAVLVLEDQPGKPVERGLRDVATAIIVHAEQSARNAAVRAREHLIQRKAEIVEAERKRKAEEERRRLERIAKAEKARVDHLLAQAAALHRAQQIRAYVESVRTLNATSPDPMSPEELASWSDWALAQADRIDPVISGAFRTRPAEPEE